MTIPVIAAEVDPYTRAELSVRWWSVIERREGQTRQEYVAAYAAWVQDVYLAETLAGAP